MHSSSWRKEKNSLNIYLISGKCVWNDTALFQHEDTAAAAVASLPREGNSRDDDKDDDGDYAAMLNENHIFSFLKFFLFIRRRRRRQHTAAVYIPISSNVPLYFIRWCYCCCRSNNSIEK